MIELGSKHETHSEFWAILRAICRPRYPGFALLVLIIRLLPIGSAKCERIFSLMNRIKPDLRSRIRTDRINGIMAAKRLAPGLDTLALEELSEWMSI